MSGPREPAWARRLAWAGMAVWVLLALAGVAWVLVHGPGQGGLPW